MVSTKKRQWIKVAIFFNKIVFNRDGIVYDFPNFKKVPVFKS